MRTFEACWGGANAPRAPPLVTGLGSSKHMDLGKFWSDLKLSAEAFVINDLKSCFPVISRLGGSNFFQVDLSLKI